MREIEKEEKALKDNPNHPINVELVINVSNTLSRAGVALTKLVDIADHDKRLKDVEYLLSKIPEEVLVEARAKHGN